MLEQSPLAAIRRRGVDVVGFARGCDYTWCNTTAGFAAAVDAAKRADVAIVFIGLWLPGTTAEGGIGGGGGIRGEILRCEHFMASVKIYPRTILSTPGTSGYRL